jgi:hypothetical protein
MELLKISSPATLQGENLLSATFESRAYTRTKGPSTDLAVDLEAVLEGGGKGIRDAAAARVEGYDLRADPAEQSPQSDPALTAGLGALLDAHREANAQARPARIQPSNAPIDRELREHQIQMGYGKQAGD